MYEPKFPRVRRRRWGFILRKAVEACLCLVIQCTFGCPNVAPRTTSRTVALPGLPLFSSGSPCVSPPCFASLSFFWLLADVLMRQFMLPVLQASGAKPSHVDLSNSVAASASSGSLQRMLSFASSFMFDQMKLAIPSMIVWLTGFYAIFVSHSRSDRPPACLTRAVSYQIAITDALVTVSINHVALYCMPPSTLLIAHAPTVLASAAHFCCPMPVVLPVLQHCWCGILAELLRFADRTFYLDFWNATTIDAFWRKWNVPVSAHRVLYAAVASLWPIVEYP